MLAFYLKITREGPIILLYYCSYFFISDFKFNLLSIYVIFLTVLAIWDDDSPKHYFSISLADFNSLSAFWYSYLSIKLVAIKWMMGRTAVYSFNCLAIECAQIKLEYCFSRWASFLW